MRDIIGDCSLLQKLKLPEPVSTRFRVRRAGNLAAKEVTSSGRYCAFPWDAPFNKKPKQALKQVRNPLRLARHYQAPLDTGKFENRAALARHLGVSQARVTQVLGRLREHSVK